MHMMDMAQAKEFQKIEKKEEVWPKDTIDGKLSFTKMKYEVHKISVNKVEQGEREMKKTAVKSE